MLIPFINRTVYERKQGKGMNINKIVVRKWTWQWLALLGLVGLSFYTTILVEVIIEVERETRPAATYHEEAEESEGSDAIPVFYDYPYSDVALAKREGDNANIYQRTEF